jgi:hypothetical protein
LPLTSLQALQHFCCSVCRFLLKFIIFNNFWSKHHVATSESSHTSDKHTPVGCLLGLWRWLVVRLVLSLLPTTMGEYSQSTHSVAAGLDLKVVLCETHRNSVVTVGVVYPAKVSP